GARVLSPRRHEVFRLSQPAGQCRMHSHGPTRLSLPSFTATLWLQASDRPTQARMKIVLISADYPPTAGGVADYTLHLGDALAELGHDVLVLPSRRARCAPTDEPMRSAGRVAPVIEGWGLRGVVSAARRLRDTAPDIIGLQYVPAMYGRGGVAPAI